MSVRQLGILFVLSAPSGAGKTSIRRKLLELAPNLSYSVSHSTRLPRQGERDGEDYHFISAELFDEMVVRGEFIEHAQVHGHSYGTSLASLEKHVSAGLDVVLDIDVQGADQIHQTYRLGPVVTIFVLPPTRATLGERLRRRASEDAKELEERLQNAPREIPRYKDYDYTIINRDLDHATWQVSCIVEAERCRSRNFASIKDLLSDI